MEERNAFYRKLRYTGTLVNYFVVCARKAWLFAKGLGMEAHSDLVDIGKLISETTFPRTKHEVDIDRTIVMDWVDWHRKIIHEVKKSPKLEEAHLWQVRYYLYYLEQKGALGFKAIINYPTQRRLKEVTLTEDDRTALSKLLQELDRLIHESLPPPPKRIPACSKCAYYEFCWV